MTQTLYNPEVVRRVTKEVTKEVRELSIKNLIYTLKQQEYAASAIISILKGTFSLSDDEAAEKLHLYS